MKARIVSMAVLAFVLAFGLVGCGSPSPKRDLPYTSQKKLERWNRERCGDMCELKHYWRHVRENEWGERKFAGNAEYPTPYRD